MKLHGYFRSSAAYRVRIALNLKGLTAQHLPHHLRKGEQSAPAYLTINPQGLVPTLEGDAQVTVPAGSSCGRRLRLRGAGLGGGDLYAVVKIVVNAGLCQEKWRVRGIWRFTSL